MEIMKQYMYKMEIITKSQLEIMELKQCYWIEKIDPNDKFIYKYKDDIFAYIYKTCFQYCACLKSLGE
jgi:hypothetical protein